NASGDKNLNILSYAALLTNAGVADLAAGQAERCATRFDQVEKIAQQLGASKTTAPANRALTSALLYNRAMLLAGSGNNDTRRQAVDNWINYLQTASVSSAWRPVGYALYQKLCQDLQIQPKDLKELAKPGRDELRPLTSVTIAGKDKVIA